MVRRVLRPQRNSPLRLRFADGELTVSAQTRTSARPASPAGALRGRARWRSASTRSSSATGSSGRLADRAVQADQPAAARPCSRARSDDYTYLIMPIRLAG